MNIFVSIFRVSLIANTTQETDVIIKINIEGDNPNQQIETRRFYSLIILKFI